MSPTSINSPTPVRSKRGRPARKTNPGAEPTRAGQQGEAYSATSTVLAAEASESKGNLKVGIPPLAKRAAFGLWTYPPI